MKKYVLLIGAAVLLVACGQKENTENNFDEEAFDEQYGDELEELFSENDTEEESGAPTTGDPLEFVEEGKDGLRLIDGANEYEAKSYYVTDDTDENGFNTYKDGDFEMRYAIIETENAPEMDEEEREREVQIFGEIINGTEDNYYFDDGTVEIKTNENEESELSFGFNGAGMADQKSKFIDGFNLDYDIPESFTLKVLEPTIRDYGESFEEDTGLDEYDNEEELKEYIEEKTVINKEFHKE